MIDLPRSSLGFVWLVGAGPGAIDLITVRGLNLLREADAVVCDDLVNRELLQHCRSSVELHFAGKRAGCRGATQAEINALLVALGSAGKNCSAQGRGSVDFWPGGRRAAGVARSGHPVRDRTRGHGGNGGECGRGIVAHPPRPGVGGRLCDGPPMCRHWLHLGLGFIRPIACYALFLYGGAPFTGNSGQSHSPRNGGRYADCPD